MYIVAGRQAHLCQGLQFLHANKLGSIFPVHTLSLPLLPQSMQLSARARDGRVDHWSFPQQLIHTAKHLKETGYIISASNHCNDFFSNFFHFTNVHSKKLSITNLFSLSLMHSPFLCLSVYLSLSHSHSISLPPLFLT